MPTFHESHPHPRLDSTAATKEERSVTSPPPGAEFVCFARVSAVTRVAEAALATSMPRRQCACTARAPYAWQRKDIRTAHAHVPMMRCEKEQSCAFRVALTLGEPLAADAARSMSGTCHLLEETHYAMLRCATDASSCVSCWRARQCAHRPGHRCCACVTCVPHQATSTASNPTLRILPVSSKQRLPLGA